MNTILQMESQDLILIHRPSTVDKQIENTLKCLGLSYIDLYYVHRLDKATPIEKTIEEMVELKNAGKIKYLGLSECSANSLRRAHAVHPISCVQMEYSPFSLDIESPQTKLLETARELGVAIVAYSQLGNGFLTGTILRTEDFTKLGDSRKILPWLKEANLQGNLAVVDKITDIAKAKGITTAQLALAWLLAQGDDIFAIPGTTKVHRLAENLGSLSVSLSPEEEKSIRQLSEAVVEGRFQAMTGYDFGDTPAGSSRLGGKRATYPSGSHYLGSCCHFNQAEAGKYRTQIECRTMAILFTSFQVIATAGQGARKLDLTTFHPFSLRSPHVIKSIQWRVCPDSHLVPRRI
jgi:aryl-alcohol dehydrogenase-like predicted oxidoreductase